MKPTSSEEYMNKYKNKMNKKEQRSSRIYKKKYIDNGIPNK